MLSRQAAAQRFAKLLSRGFDPPVRQAAKTAGSVWPAIIASIMALPLTPTMSEMTESSLMLASSSVFCSR